jgi:hypothetical protein
MTQKTRTLQADPAQADGFPAMKANPLPPACRKALDKAFETLPKTLEGLHEYAHRKQGAAKLETEVDGLHMSFQPETDVSVKSAIKCSLSDEKGEIGYGIGGFQDDRSRSWILYTTVRGERQGEGHSTMLNRMWVELSQEYGIKEIMTIPLTMATLVSSLRDGFTIQDEDGKKAPTLEADIRKTVAEGETMKDEAKHDKYREALIMLNEENIRRQIKGGKRLILAKSLQ